MAQKKKIRKRVSVSRLQKLKDSLTKHKGTILAGTGMGLAGAVLGAGYGAKTILNMKDSEKPLRRGLTVNMVKDGNIYKRSYK